MRKLRNLPAAPGVYVMRDSKARVLYVGKASSLRSRVRSYFQGNRDLHPRTRTMVGKIADLDVIAVANQMEALILESNLIKKHRPPFNVKLRDDKRYPMLEITTGETYPRLKLVRRALNRTSRYFGPYTNSHALRKTMKVLQRVFKIRTCTPPLATPLDRPCLDYHIQQCSAPCTRYVTVEEYRESVDEACEFLEGHTDTLIRALRKQMQDASEALEFERCVRLRNVLQALEQVTERQRVVSGERVDEDALAFVEKDGLGCVQVLQVREGKLVEESHFVLEEGAYEAPGKMLQTFLMQHYGQGIYVPPAVLTSHEPEDPEEVSQWLARMREAHLESRQIAETPSSLPLEFPGALSVPGSVQAEGKASRARRVELKVPQRGARRELMA
ncbi:MAG: excinuclease ABC subunit C, partial [Armatimonadetes bacterium]|nr:excinuclease ABC subunit C [Armatimonadota bacterium]